MKKLLLSILFLSLFSLVGCVEDISLGGTKANVGKPSEFARGVVEQADGKVVAAGRCYDSVEEKFNFCIKRYDSDGFLDSTFGVDGVSVVAVSDGENEAQAVALQADGKIVVSGYDNRDAIRFAIVRLNTDGSLDTSFSGNGIVIESVGLSDNAMSVAVQSDGKIVAGGHCLNTARTENDLCVARFNSNGSLDTSFSGDGKVMTDIGKADHAKMLDIQADGKIILGGACQYDRIVDGYEMSSYDFCFARYNTNGSLDNSFDGDGIVVTHLGFRDDILNALTIQSDGKMIATGGCQYRYGDVSYDFCTARYNTNGSLDTSFNGVGSRNDILWDNNNMAYGITQQSDGKVVISGFAYDGTYNDMVLVRYNINGSLDSSFGVNGKTFESYNQYGIAYSVIQLSSGKLLAGGGATGQSFELARFNTDGTIDATGFYQ